MILLGHDATVPTPGLTGPPTYETLQAALTQLPRKDIATLTSLLGVWRDVHGVVIDAPLGDEFMSGYPDAITAFSRARAASGASDSTIKSDRSRLGAIQKVAVALFDAAQLHGSFAERLTSAKELRGVSWYSLARAIEAQTAVVIGWANGECSPGPLYRGRLGLLEEKLGLPQGALSSALAAYPEGSRFSQSSLNRSTSAFGSRLREAITASGLLKSQISKKTGIDQGALRDWTTRTASFPNPKNRLRIPSLETVLGLSQGTLANLLPPVPPRLQPYAITFSAAQRREWDTFVRHKTDKEQSDPAKRPQEFWRVHKDGTVPTAGKCERTLAMYGGWMTTYGPDELRDMLSANPDHFGLLDLARADAFELFVRWKARRKNQNVPEYNSGHIEHLTFALSTLRAKTGYLWQANALDLNTVALRRICVGASGATPTLSEWRAHCDDAHRKLTAFKEHLEDQGLVRAPVTHYDKISPILGDERPMDFLLVLVERMRADLPRVEEQVSRGSRSMLAAFRRDLLLMELLTSNPLRLRNWRTLTYNVHNSGQLRRDDDGNYRLCIPQDEFKALSGFREHDYEAVVPQSLTQQITNYLTEDRPLLVGASECEYFFRPKNLTGQNTPDARCRPFQSVAERVARWSSVYLQPELKGVGFRTHAVRHVIATHFVKTYGHEGFALAADALHNTETMIRQHYGHLVAKDHTRRAHELIANEYAKAKALFVAGAA